MSGLSYHESCGIQIETAKDEVGAAKRRSRGDARAVLTERCGRADALQLAAEALGLRARRVGEDDGGRGLGQPLGFAQTQPREVSHGHYDLNQTLPDCLQIDRSRPARDSGCLPGAVFKSLIDVTRHAYVRGDAERGDGAADPTRVGRSE